MDTLHEATEEGTGRHSQALSLGWEYGEQRVRVFGEVGALNARLLSELIDGCALDAPRELTLDIEGLSVMDGAGIRAIVQAGRDLAASGRKLVIAGASVILRKALALVIPPDLRSFIVVETS